MPDDPLDKFLERVEVLMAQNRKELGMPPRRANAKSRKKKSDAAVKRANDLRLLLLEAAPSCPVELAALVAIDLADLIDVADDHKKRMRQLLRPTKSRNKDRMGTLLADIDVNWLFHADYHLKSLKKNLPKYVKHLHKPSKSNA